MGDTGKASGHISTPSTGFERDKPAGYPDSSSKTNEFKKKNKLFAKTTINEVLEC